MPGNSAHEYEVREAINEVVDASRKFLDTDERPVRRDQHPKQNGCVRARFIVAKNLGEPYRQGLFQEEKVYEAWIRLSNGREWDDRKPDAHGMAVKLMGVEGPKVLASERDATTQDFVMVDNPTFFLRGAVEYARYSELLLKAKGKEPSSLYNVAGLFLSGPIHGLLTLFLLSLFHWRLLTFLRLIRFASKRIANPVTTRYWSTTPYRFGDTCMKFSAVPAEFPGGLPAEGPGDDSTTRWPISSVRPLPPQRPPHHRRKAPPITSARRSRTHWPCEGPFSSSRSSSSRTTRQPRSTIQPWNGPKTPRPSRPWAGSGSPSRSSTRRAGWPSARTCRSPPGMRSWPMSPWARSTRCARSFTPSSPPCATA